MHPLENCHLTTCICAFNSYVWKLSGAQLQGGKLHVSIFKLHHYTITLHIPCIVFYLTYYKLYPNFFPINPKIIFSSCHHLTWTSPTYYFVNINSFEKVVAHFEEGENWEGWRNGGREERKLKKMTVERKQSRRMWCLVTYIYVCVYTIALVIPPPSNHTFQNLHNGVYV